MRNSFKILGFTLLTCANVFCAAFDHEPSDLSRSPSVPHLPVALKFDPSGVSISDLATMNTILKRNGKALDVIATQDENASQSVETMTKILQQNHKKRVLSLDGGGTRGVICLAWLVEIERLTGRRIHQIFDHIVGTSTGGLIAALLTLRGIRYEDPKIGISINTADEPMSAQQALDLFKVLAKEIFSKTASKLGSMYLYTLFKEKPLETLLDLLAKGRSITECQPPITVTSYDIKENRRKLFSSFDTTKKFGLAYCLRATTAAPGYFNPTSEHLIDGGVSHNNPSIVAITQTKEHLNTPFLNQILVSINNGSFLPPMEATGMAALTRPSIGLKVLDVMFSGKATDTDCEDLFKGLEAPENYFRFETPLPDARYNEVSLTDFTSLNELIAIAQSVMQMPANQEKLARMVKALDLQSPSSEGDTPDVISIPSSSSS